MPNIDFEAMIADARSLVGTETRWRHQGREPGVGLDCIGFPRWLYIRQLGNLPDALEAEFNAYHRRPDGQKFLATFRSWFDEVEQDGSRSVWRRMGDLLVIKDRGNPQHTALACDEKHVVEAYANGRNMKIIYWPLDPFREIAGVFRFPTEGEKAEKWRIT